MRWEDRELKQARSKPDIVDQPVRTAHTCAPIAHNSITESFLNIPLPPDQHHISDAAMWR